MKIPQLLFSRNVIRLRYLVAATVLMLASFPLHANAVLPGGTVLPDIFSIPGGSPPLLGDISGTFSFGSGIGLLTGTWEEAVLVDPFGITCSGCLDFAFVVDEDPLLSSGIFALGPSRFFGYATDVGYIDGTGITPISVSRGPFGGGITFNFVTPGSPPTNVIGPGGGSAILVVATNAKSFDSFGILSISGGREGSPANGQISGIFEPTFVPEPSTALLLGFGMTGLTAFRKRKRID